jgi:hypothetical protein
MKIKVNLSIGYPTATHENVLEVNDSELEGLTEEEREDYLMEETRIWANEYIEYWYEELKS